MRGLPPPGTDAMRPPPVHGLLVLDKPGGLTSRDAVDRAQGWFPRGTKIGHSGTLDPLATGVLVLGIGVATRLLEYVQDMAKTYQAVVRLGATSDTDDADGTVTEIAGATPPSRDAVADALASFLGEIDQVPPAFSAAKVTGRRAYDLARRGEDVALRPRRVRVYRIDLQRYAYPELEIEVHCGKGTYIRSLARDLGARLGCGGLITVLRRLRVGPFEAADAVSLDADAATARARLRPVAEALAELPRLDVGADAARRLRQGQALPLPALPEGAETAAVFGPSGGLVGVARLDRPAGLLRPEKVLPEGD